MRGRRRYWGTTVASAGVLAGAALVIMVGALPSRASSSPPTAWQLLDDGDPSDGSYPMVYDTARHREVLFENHGPYYTQPAAAHPPVTWELVGEDWVRRFLPEPTPWFPKGCMAYDQVRGKTVLFGSLGNDETWEYDGTSWVKKDLAVRPPSRWHCGMVYDTARQVIVMFGGEDENQNPFGDTWEYDGTSWVERTFSTSPAARSEVSLSYDPDRHVTVLYGGRIPFGLLYGDTWEYNGTKWIYKNKYEQYNPSARSNATMAYDPLLQKTVLFGGYTPFTDYNETWEWDGTRWTQAFPTQSPPLRDGMSLVWDPQRQRIVGYGGIYNNGTANDTWSFDGTTWTRIALSGLPRVRLEPGLAYDPRRDRLVLYGGGNYDLGPDPNYTDTWIYQEGAWAKQDSAGTTGTGLATPLIFDDKAGVVRGFSGYPEGYFVFTPNVHDLDEGTTTWSDLPEYGPDGRYEGAIAYAPWLGGLAVFGGLAHNSSGFYLANDTWFFDGTSFSQRTTAHVPLPRDYYGLTYDSLRNRLMLFGGNISSSGDSSRVGDTWAFDGTDWQELFADSAPGARRGISLVYDSARHRVVMFGDGPVGEGVTWEFDGTSWLAMPTPFMPEPTRCWEGLAYDSKREVTWLFGGENCWGLEYSNDTWAYGPDPDGDGIVGGLDNCASAANASQANADGDAAGDACDCAVADPSAWSAPQDVAGLALSGGSTTTLTWADQSGTVGPGVRYDVASGDLIELQQSGSFSGSACLAGQTATPSASDGRVPGAGGGYWYLVRARNVCGIGSYGAGGLDAVSPCP